MTLKVATSVPILIFLGLSVLEYATDRQTSDVRQKHRLMPPPIRGGGIIMQLIFEPIMLLQLWGNDATLSGTLNTYHDAC